MAEPGPRGWLAILIYCKVIQRGGARARRAFSAGTEQGNDGSPKPKCCSPLYRPRFRLIRPKSFRTNMFLFNSCPGSVASGLSAMGNDPGREDHDYGNDGSPEPFLDVEMEVRQDDAVPSAKRPLLSYKEILEAGASGVGLAKTAEQRAEDGRNRKRKAYGNDLAQRVSEGVSRMAPIVEKELEKQRLFHASVDKVSSALAAVNSLEISETNLGQVLRQHFWTLDSLRGVDSLPEEVLCLLDLPDVARSVANFVSNPHSEAAVCGLPCFVGRLKPSGTADSDKVVFERPPSTTETDGEEQVDQMGQRWGDSAASLAKQLGQLAPPLRKVTDMWDISVVFPNRPPVNAKGDTFSSLASAQSPEHSFNVYLRDNLASTANCFCDYIIFFHLRLHLKFHSFYQKRHRPK